MSAPILNPLFRESEDLYRYNLKLNQVYKSKPLDIFGLNTIQQSLDVENYLDSYDYMRSLQDIAEIYQSNYFLENFLVRYANNIPLFALEVCNTQLTWQQVEICENHNPYGGRLAVPSGHGCHGVDTPIMLSDGSVKKVQDIRVNDYLMGGDGKGYRRVLELVRGKSKLYEFTFKDGSTQVYNEEHILVLTVTQTKGRRTRGDIVEVTVKEYLSWAKTKKRVHAIIRKPLTFENPSPLPIDPYLLGLWLGDGSKHDMIIYNIDEEIINHLNSIGDVTIYTSDNRVNGYRLSGYQKKLRELGVYGNKHIPKIYLTSSLEDRLQLLSGLLDSDGHLSRNNRFEITQKIEQLSRDIVYLAKSCGLHATIKRVGQYHRVTITRNISIIPTKIKRKQVTGSNTKRLVFGVRNVSYLGIGDYYGFKVDGDNLYLDGDFNVIHNCGKTKLIGILALHHMLCSIKSITRIQAPKLEQITKLSFGEVIQAIDGMKRDVTINGRTIPNQWAFLADFIVTNQKLIYIKNHQTSWYIESAVAKRGESNSLSGQHNWSYLLILDEACGIEDGHIVASLGGLSEERNSCIAFSQHANTSSMFHLFVTTLSVENGGVWRLVRLNSEESPLVSDEALLNWFATYTEDEYRVRVLGLFPLNESGNLFSLQNMKQAYEGIFAKTKRWLKSINWFSRTFATDIAYKGLRDSSVTIRANVSKVINEMGIERLFVDVTDIEVFHKETKLRPTEVGKLAIRRMVDEIIDKGKNFYEYLQGVDATAGGNETFLVMGDEVMNATESIDYTQIDVFALEWGGNRRMSNKERREYVNERAKGYILLRKAIQENRFTISTPKYKTRILREMENIPFKFDAKYRYQIVSKQELGTASPDIMDCFAELFIIPHEDATHLNEHLATTKEDEIKMRMLERKESQREEIEMIENDEFSIDIETIGG